MVSAEIGTETLSIIAIIVRGNYHLLQVQLRPRGRRALLLRSRTRSRMTVTNRDSLRRHVLCRGFILPAFDITVQGSTTCQWIRFKKVRFRVHLKWVLNRTGALRGCPAKSVSWHRQRASSMCGPLHFTGRCLYRRVSPCQV